ncbi:hypothetical protein GJ496_006373 [Pomphorhynchus laevis]|nr:hypothetical protein GJ496_006373 [Pomphorhynchus laevis]
MESLLQLKRRLSHWTNTADGILANNGGGVDDDYYVVDTNDECASNNTGGDGGAHTTTDDDICNRQNTNIENKPSQMSGQERIIGGGSGGGGGGHHAIRKIKIVRTEGTINYDIVDSFGKQQPHPLAGQKPFTSPFIVRVEPLPKQRDALRRQFGVHQQQRSYQYQCQPQQRGLFQSNDHKTFSLAKCEPSHFTNLAQSDNNDYMCQTTDGGSTDNDKMYMGNAGSGNAMRKFPFRQRRSVNPSITDEEVRSAYAKLRLTLPNCSYDEMSESERGVYRFVRRRLMNKNSARQSRLRRKELFKEYENTINLQAQNLQKTENKLRLLLKCFLNAVTLISLQSIPQMIDPNNFIVDQQQSSSNSCAIPHNSNLDGRKKCEQCYKVHLFNEAMLDAVSMFEQDYYSESEGIQQLLVELRVCSQEQPMHQLFQRQERVLHNIFSKSIKNNLCNEAVEGSDVIPIWKFNLITSNALRSAWSIFLGPDEQDLLFEHHEQQLQPIKEETPTSTYFESVVNDLFDPIKHAELLKSLRTDDINGTPTCKLSTDNEQHHC